MKDTNIYKKAIFLGGGGSSAEAVRTVGKRRD